MQHASNQKEDHSESHGSRVIIKVEIDRKRFFFKNPKNPQLNLRYSDF